MQTYTTTAQDLVYLGYCRETSAGPPPLCAHAYAVRGAALPTLIANVYPCAPEAVDQQLQRVIKAGLLTYGVVNMTALGTTLLAPQRTDDVATKGLFYQELW